LSSIYEVTADPDDENSSHAFMFSMIGYNKSVLELGCSTGYFTKVLVERGCNVVGIELDPEAAAIAEKWADRVIVGNLDEGDVWSLLEDEAFDVIVMGDVLEHLRDPLTALRHAVRKVKPSGVVVTSLPNIAHGDVRIALMQGKFRYAKFGLLDRTHMRFFTLESARDLFTQAGLIVVDTKRVIVPLFLSELGVKRNEVSHKVLDELLEDPEVESYQFVMKSVRDDGTRAVKDLARRVRDLTDHMHEEEVRRALFRTELHDARLERQELRRRAGDALGQKRGAAAAGAYGAGGGDGGDGAAGTGAGGSGTAVSALQEYVEALEGHVTGLEHNIEVLTTALTESDQRYRSVLNSRAMRMTAPIRWLRRTVRLGGRTS
jgi:2-polyprenyl-3-methyl-5-hydroxy-6-metoxy-1,4-benzoquinol methylase